MPTLREAETDKSSTEQQVLKLIAIGEVDDAARLAEKNNMLDRAIVLYKKASDFRSVGRLYEQQEKLKEAMLAFERGKIFDEAARIADKLGEKRKAERFYTLYQKQEYPSYKR